MPTKKVDKSVNGGDETFVAALLTYEGEVNKLEHTARGLLKSADIDTKNFYASHTKTLQGVDVALAMYQSNGSGDQRISDWFSVLHQRLALLSKYVPARFELQDLERELAVLYANPNDFKES